MATPINTVQITATTPWYVGQTYPTVAIPLNTDSGVDNVTGMTPKSFVVLIKNIDAGGVENQGTGTIQVYSANPAILYYTFSPADVSASGQCQIQIQATFPNGGVAFYDPIPFYIKGT